MHAILLVLLSTIGSTRTADEAAYEKARQSFYALKADPEQRKDRERWLSAAARFEAVATKYPQSGKAAQALYTAAELRSELSRLSFVAADRHAALADYRRVAKAYAASDLADDALYQAARIELDRENDPEAARADLKSLVERYPQGDMVRRAKALLATLGPEPKKVAVAKKEKVREAAEKRVEKVKPEVAEAPAPAPLDDESEDDEAPTTIGSGGPSAAQPSASAAPLPPDPAASQMLAHPLRPSATPTPTPTPNAIATAIAKFAVALRPERDRGTGGERTHDASQGIQALKKAGAAPGGIPLAVQMGLRIRRVVIDAGHGGHDTGAVGPGGTQEKDVTLAIALKLAQELKAKGLEVLLTRDDDRFVPLEGRAEFANDHKADLFISIHANANPDHKFRGLETFFLNVTDDRYAIRLAARENQASERSISDLQLILADLATKSNVEESHELASVVQHSIIEDLGEHKTRERDLGVKQALFYVLLGVKMPAILVETAFVSNPTEEKRLKAAAFQEEIAKDIANGVERFMRDRRELAGL
jgi:N-acetylmuramoyl-L-alanine amidase